MIIKLSFFNFETDLGFKNNLPHSTTTTITTNNKQINFNNNNKNNNKMAARNGAGLLNEEIDVDQLQEEAERNMLEFPLMG